MSQIVKNTRILGNKLGFTTGQTSQNGLWKPKPKTRTF